MPKALEQKLQRQAASQGLKGEHRDAYVYGTLRKTGWVPRRERETADAVQALRERARR